MSEPLPGMPEPPPPKQLARRPGVRATRVPPTQRHLCQDCCALIHTLGAAVAPFPGGARWRVTYDDSTRIDVCEMHKEERM